MRKTNFIMKHIFSNKINLIIFLLLSSLSAAASANLSIFLGNLFDLTGTQEFNSFRTITIKISITLLLVVILSLSGDLFKSKMLKNINIHIRTYFIEKLLLKSIHKFNENKHSEYASVLINDISSIEDLYVNVLISIFENTIKLAVSVIYISSINIISTIMVMVFSIIHHFTVFIF